MANHSEKTYRSLEAEDGFAVWELPTPPKYWLTKLILKQVGGVAPGLGNIRLELFCNKRAAQPATSLSSGGAEADDGLWQADPENYRVYHSIRNNEGDDKADSLHRYYGQVNSIYYTNRDFGRDAITKFNIDNIPSGHNRRTYAVLHLEGSTGITTWDLTLGMATALD